MPSASSPAPAMPSSPKTSTGHARPGLVKRHSSHASSQAKQAARDVVSSGSQPEGQQALRHPVKSNKHARIVLPRNHSSGRNLAKMARQTMAAQETAQRQNHGRHRSHENDTEIRLPGSLDESSPAQQQVQLQQRPPMRRNMTSYHLSRNSSHTKLKKNLSHGQLQRLNSRGNLASMGQASNKAPPSPGLKGKSKRPKSADMSKWALEKDLHEQEVELAQRLAEKRAGGPKKVGFAVGSSGDSDDDTINMEGAENEEAEWTEESTSASPYSTRQNTANNSRRTSMAQDRATDRAPLATQVMVSSDLQQPPKVLTMEQQAANNGTKVAGEEEEEDEEDETDEDDDEEPSPRSTVKRTPHADGSVSQPIQEKQSQQPSPTQESDQQTQQPQKISQVPRSPLYAAKEHPNPTMPLLRNASGTTPAPAMTSNVNALDNSHSARASPATSTLSTRSTLAGDGEDELVSRFIPSASHPNTGSNPTTTQNTPKTTHFHTPEADSNIHHHNKHRHSRHQSQQPDPVSPGNSTVSASGSSGTATPAIGRSRIELKMLQEKAMADINSVVDRNPFIPAHVYDRRNESLKSYLNLAALNNNALPPSTTSTNTLANSSNLSLGPEIFQGRFKAVHTELRVVQKFRDPLAESLARLRSCKGSKLSLRNSPQKLHAAALRTSKSAVSLPAAGKIRGGAGALHSRAVSGAAAEKGLSGSPLKGGPVGAPPALQSSKSSVNVQQQGRRQGQRGVSFASEEPSGHAVEGESAEESVDAVARRMWADLGSVGA